MKTLSLALSGGRGDEDPFPGPLPGAGEPEQLEVLAMQVVTNYPDGVFNWIDLTTTDVAGAKAFYGGLFGWTADDRPTGGGPDYTMMMLDGHPVAGATPMSSDMQAMGMPPVWVSYVKIDDIDGAAARAVEAGGAVFVPPMDVLDSGRMALVQDPTGAAFGMWSPRAFAGAALVNRPNTLAWNELQTRDLPAARAFYEHVFGWTADEMSDCLLYTSCATSAQAWRNFGVAHLRCGAPSVWRNFST